MTNGSSGRSMLVRYSVSLALGGGDHASPAKMWRRMNLLQGRISRHHLGTVEDMAVKVGARFVGGVLVGTGIGCKFSEFLFDFPVPLEFGLSQAQKNEVLKVRMGGDISCPLYKQIFWDGAVSPDGRVQFKLPVQGPHCSATIHGKGIYNMYGGTDQKTWFFSLYASIDSEGGVETIDLIDPGVVDSNTDPLSEEDKKRVLDQSRNEAFFAHGNQDQNVRSI
jgi:hypothetical protein